TLQQQIGGTVHELLLVTLDERKTGPTNRVGAGVVFERAPPIGMVLHKPARLPQYAMPDVEGRSERRAIISRSCRNIDLLERRQARNFSVGHRIHGHAAREANVT